MPHGQASLTLWYTSTPRTPPSQWALWRKFKFYLALENHICEGYLTEKALKSLMRGQVRQTFLKQ